MVNRIPVKLFASLLFVLFYCVPTFTQESDPLLTATTEAGVLEDATIDATTAVSTEISSSVADKILDVNSQSGSAQNFFIEDTENGKIFRQRLSWQSIPDILRYEVIIEQFDESLSEFVELDHLQAETNNVIVSLEMGLYRYQVLVFNLLDRLEIASDWYSFQIIKAIQPILDSVSPMSMYLEEDNDGIFSINGENLFGSAVYALRPQGETVDAYHPLSFIIQPGNEAAQLQFDINQLDVGVYDFMVTNQGGLYDYKGPVVIKFQKLIDFDVSFGYICPVVLYDDTMETYFDTTVFPISIIGRATYIPFKRRYGYCGIGLNQTYTYMRKTTSTYVLSGNMFTTHLNFVYQYPIIKKRLMVELHGGPGVTIFNNVQFEFDHNILSKPLNSVSLSVDAGIVFQVYISKRLYIEAGCDFVNAFLSDMALGMLFPSCSVGWQF